ncbi:hypothetical protein Vretimale_4673 [Volvox reticuliferus]|uniref:Uncharacterized protein n=1 Tax=Volvox reticuliferus TaxID=1737510 RepID=A0A8J4FEL2_9CHLO|nr:hypothetical protein Vretifemale_3283 [Volvox reticuliferus]GIL99533.1 hypothetical protein Vretimale_4673 [Volvox reticuliferus]
MDSSNFKVVCDHCDAKLANVFCHSDGAFLCPQCDAQVHSVNKLAQRHVRVPCHSCPVWAYREAKSRGRLLDMPLAASLTRNLQLDIFDGTIPCWPSNNASSVAMGTPQSDASSPQAAAAAPPANAGSPGSEVHAAPLHKASNSWPQNSALAMVASQPIPQPGLGWADQVDAVRTAAQFAISPFSNCSAGSLQTTVNARHPQPAAEQGSVQGAQVSTSAAAAQQHLSQAAQSQHSQHTLQRAASQEVMDAVDSMDVSLLLDTFGTPLDQMQDSKRKGEMPQQQQEQLQQQAQQPCLTPYQHAVAEPQLPSSALCSAASVPSTGMAVVAALGNPVGMSVTWAQQVQVQQQPEQFLLQQQQIMHEQLQLQQRQVQMNTAAIAAAAAGCLVSPNAFGVTSSEPMAVPAQRQQPAVRSMSGLSCLSQSGLSSSNTDGQQLGSARSSNTMLLQSLEQQITGAAPASTCPVPISLAGAVMPSAGTTVAAAAGWPSIEVTQRQLQQLQQQQQQVALQLLQKQQQQHQALQQLLQHSRPDELQRTSAISIGNGGPAATVLTTAAARRDINLRAGLGSSDPGIRRGRSLAQSPVSLQPSAAGTVFASPPCSLLDNLSGLGIGPSSIAAAAAVSAGVIPNNNLAAAAAASRLLPGTVGVTVAGPHQPLAATRSVDAAASSFGALPAAVVGSGGSTSVSPSNCNTLAGAVSERHLPLTAQQLAQQMVLPGSAPPALGLAATVSMFSRGGSCDLGESHLMRLSSDGYDAVLGAAAAANMRGGGMGILGLGGCDVDAAGVLTRLERPDGTYKELDPERAAQLNRQKRMLRMRALAEGAKKVRYECRKQLADTRPRVRGRFAKVNSSDALMEIGGSGVGKVACGVPTSSSGNITTTGSVVSGSACTAPPGIAYHGPSGGGSGWGLHGHASSQPHMQRIDEEGTSEGQSPLVMQPTACHSLPHQASSSDPDTGMADGSTAGEGAVAPMATGAIEACAGLSMLSGFGSAFGTDQRTQLLQVQEGSSHQQLQLRRAKSSSMMDGSRVFGSAPAGLLASCANASTTSAPDAGLAATTQDCAITEHDLAALGFEDLTQFSGGGFSNAENSNEDMDESAESMNDGNPARPVPRQGPGLEEHPSSQRPSVQAMLPQAVAQLSETPTLGATTIPPLQQHQHQMLRAQSLVVPKLTAAGSSLQPQPQAQAQLQIQQQQRLSVLDRPIMYGTDLSQFSAAQLSLLDSILTDQYRPSGPTSRH